MKLSTEFSRKLYKTIITYLFAFYKVGMRPHFGNACRFHPSCSSYSKQAFESYGFFNAFFLTVYRLLRCHPFSKGGLDPVPCRKEVING